MIFISLFKYLLLAGILLGSLSSCAQEIENQNKNSFQISFIEAKPHNSKHFTQGLFFDGARLYESIGLNGQSALIKYNLNNLDISIKRTLDAAYFAEGATLHQDVIYQLSWQAGKAFAYKGAMLSPAAGFDYEGEGWGLTSDGENLWLSNGSSELQLINTEGETLKKIQISYNNQPLDRLNELEWVNGWILANRWYDNRIFAINPHTGIAEHTFDLTELAQQELSKSRDNVLNGIAWNSQSQQLWITGKNWNQFYLFELNFSSTP